MAQDEDVPDDTPQLASFLRADEFQRDLSSFLSVELNAEGSKTEQAEETRQLSRLCDILDEYQEQSNLLDPYLEQLAGPLIEVFRAHVRQPAASLTTRRFSRLSRLVYFFTKVRGAKTIARLFPHETDDLVILLEIFDSGLSLDNASWETRYVLLLWLSLVSMLPFALKSLDRMSVPSSSTTILPTSTSRIEAIGMRYLSCSSKERDGAVALLARYHSRQDSACLPFLTLCQGILEDPATNIYLSTGIFQTICEIVKVSSPSTLLSVWDTLYRFLFICDAVAATRKGSLMGKFRAKLAGRLALLRLPASMPGTIEDMIVPDEVELIVQDLLEAVENKDTIVRWSAAKYLARIAERIPYSFSHQIVEALLGIFEDESELDGPEDASIISEHSWHGACLSLAELARRGKIPFDLVEPTLGCVHRALHFDRKRGVQSIGSGVRDSAAYVLWSLARTLSPQQVEPFASQLAIHLVSVSLFDREIQIRRAASAAFQESVGRLGVLPHGIDVLRKIDFFTVSLRKRAFLEAAPQVAEHSEYRTALLKHIVEVSLCHYDTEIRSLSASALESIVRIDPGLVAPLVESQIKSLATKDTARLHGVLLSLASLAAASDTLPTLLHVELLEKIYQALTTIPLLTLASRTSTLVLLATLAVVGKVAETLPLSNIGFWWSLIEIACKKFDETLHEDAANAMRSIIALSVRSSAQQQSAAMALGRLDYSSLNAPHVARVVSPLLAFTSTTSPKKAMSIEGKRNGIRAISAILVQSLQASSPSLTLADSSPMLETIIAGFDDYTNDQRGDVGSWVRLASIASVSDFLSTIPLDQLLQDQLLTQERLDRIVASLLKQGVERLDNVRESSGLVLEMIAGTAALYSGEVVLRGQDLFGKMSDLRDFTTTSIRILPFLAVPEYRFSILEGATLSVTPHASSSPLIDFATALPPDSSTDYDLLQFISDVCDLGSKNWSSNRVFVPVLNVLAMLLEDRILDEIVETESGETALKRMLSLATRSLAQIKSAPRLIAVVKIVVNFITILPTTAAATAQLRLLLSHSFPWLRSQTAESLHDHIVTKEDEIDPELQSLLLETEWSSPTGFEAAASRICQLLDSR